MAMRIDEDINAVIPYLCWLGHPYTWLMQLSQAQLLALIQVEVDYAAGVTYG
jgi:hypothetical protein